MKKVTTRSTRNLVLKNGSAICACLWLDGYMFLDGGDGVNKEQRAGFSL